MNGENQIISDIVDQSIDQAALLFNYSQKFNNIVISEIKNETNSIIKLNKLIHVLIEQLTTHQNESKKLNQLQNSILKIYPRAPNEINRLLRWIPKKMAKEKQKIESTQVNQIENNQEKNEVKMKKEIEQLKAKCSHITNSITLIKENFEKSKEIPDNYLDEIRQLKQSNIELHENLANAKMQNKLLKSKISSIKKQKSDEKISIQVQTSISNEKKDDSQFDDKYEVLFYELKTLKNEKEKSEQKYLSSIEYSSSLEEKIRKIQIERDTLQTKLNDQINLMKKKESVFNENNEKYEKMSQNCLKLETQITKLRDKLNKQGENFVNSLTFNNYYENETNKSHDYNEIDAMVNPFEIEFK